MWGCLNFFRFYLISLWRELWQLRFLIRPPSRSACQGAFSFVALQVEGKDYGDADDFANSPNFLGHVIEAPPLTIQRVKADRGMEFFAYEFQQLKYLSEPSACD